MAVTCMALRRGTNGQRSCNLVYTRNVCEHDATTVVGYGEDLAKAWLAKWEPYVQYHIFCLEKGDQGTLHYQGYVELTEMRTWRFLLDNVDPYTHFEKRMGTQQEAIDYVKKTGKHSNKAHTHLEGPYTSGEPKSIKGGDKPKRIPYYEVARAAIATGSFSEGRAMLLEHYPDKMLDKGTDIERNLRNYTHKPYKPKFTLDDFTIPSINLGKCVLMHGDTELGKSQFALAHFKNPLLVKGKNTEKLREYNTTVDGIVLDEVNFTTTDTHLENNLTMLDMDEDVAMWARYANVTLPAGLPKIFLTNKKNPMRIFYTYEDEVENKPQCEAIDSRVRLVNIDKDIRRMKPGSVGRDRVIIAPALLSKHSSHEDNEDIQVVTPSLPSGDEESSDESFGSYLTRNLQ